MLIVPLEPVFRIMKSNIVALPNSIIMNSINEYYGINVSKDTLLSKSKKYRVLREKYSGHLIIGYTANVIKEA
jgi:hypothetical protein